MGKLIIYLIVISMIIFFTGCTKKSEENSSKPTFQILADKEKELNDREARLKLKEIELEERERHLNTLEGTTTGDTSMMQNGQMKDTTKMTPKQKKQQKKKEIQKEITKKFENPASTVKDYYEYIQRGINETGNFESNMKKAHKYFPSRPVDKLKSGYRNTKSFTVIEEPKVLTQKDGKATVLSKVKQVQIVKKDGSDSEITKTLSVTYNLAANDNGEWVITGNSVKEE